MKRRLLQFYDSFGDRGVMFILYALAVVANSLPAIFAELPAVFPDEINVAGVSAMYSGRNWSGLLDSFGSGSGYVQALFYAPLFWVIKNPYALYKAMLIVNALLIGIIPLIAYQLAGKFGVVRVRRKLLIALCCGMYAAYITDSKFVWNETLTCLMGWILALCLFSSWERKSRSSRAALSVLAGFLCALSYAANVQNIALVAALILTALLARIFMRERILNLPVFAISITASFIAEHFLRRTIEQSLWGETAGMIGMTMNTEAAGGFFGVFFTQIYAFMTSSIGLGALAMALFFVMMFSCLNEGIKDRPKTLEDGTKVYEPIKHKYSMRLTVFAMFQFLAVGCTAAMPALLTFGGERYTAEFAVFGRYTDNIAPLAVFLVLAYIFLYGMDLVKLLIGAGLYGYSCICFGVAGIPVSQMTSEFMYSALFGLFAMFSEDASGSAGMNCIILSSLVFTLYALLLIFASCTRKYRTASISGSIFIVSMAATIFTAFVFLPRIGLQNSERQAPYKDIMSLVYNDAQSPPLVFWHTEPEAAATVQFLAPETRVEILESGGHVPGSCLLIARNDVQIPLEGGSYDVVGRTDEYTVYAFGDNARDFIRYSSSKGAPPDDPNSSGSASGSNVPGVLTNSGASGR